MAARSSVTRLSTWQRSFGRPTFASASRTYVVGSAVPSENSSEPSKERTDTAADRGVSTLKNSEPQNADARNRAAFEDLLDAVREPPDGVDASEEEFQRLLEGASDPRSNPPSWLSARPARSSSSYTPSPRSVAPRKLKGTLSSRRRGQGMTPHEGAVFNEVLDAIWRDLELSGVTKPKDSASAYGPMLSGRRREKHNVGVGAGLDAAKEVLAEQMDRLKEEMASLSTDVDLLDWARRRVFTPLKGSEETSDDIVTYPSTYPHVLAHLQKVSRTTFHNPHLALSFFQHARVLSLDSYLQGCLTPAYNEALTTRWESFRDIDGVERGIREMEVHGVGWDRGTCALIGQVVEQVSKDVLRGTGHWSDAAVSRLRKLEDLVERDVRRQERRWTIQKDQEKRSRPMGDPRQGPHGAQ